MSSCRRKLWRASRPECNLYPHRLYKFKFVYVLVHVVVRARGTNFPRAQLLFTAFFPRARKPGSYRSWILSYRYIYIHGLFVFVSCLFVCFPLIAAAKMSQGSSTSTTYSSYASSRGRGRGRGGGRGYGSSYGNRGWWRGRGRGGGWRGGRGSWRGQSSAAASTRRNEASVEHTGIYGVS